MKLNPHAAAAHCVIADDVRTSREMLRSWLAECGLLCELASDGEQAWNLVCQFRPRLVITDIEMPRCSGLELLRRIRQDVSGPLKKVSVLVITSLKDSETQNIVRQMGGNGLLVKPLDKLATYSVVLGLLADRVRKEDFLVGRREEHLGHGVISPTLRRLWGVVTNHEV